MIMRPALHSESARKPLDPDEQSTHTAHECEFLISFSLTKASDCSFAAIALSDVTKECLKTLSNRSVLAKDETNLNQSSFFESDICHVLVQFLSSTHGIFMSSIRVHGQ